MTHSSAPTSVYQYFDRWGTLIYVGVTSRQTTRQGEHVKSKDWGPTFEIKNVQVEPFNRVASQDTPTGALTASR